jgi:uncharacterized protein (DUF885 family)
MFIIRNLSATALIAMVFLTGCSSKEPPKKASTSQEQGAVQHTLSTEQQTEPEKANLFFDNAFEQRVTLAPEFQSYLGRKTNNDQWNDISEAHAEKTIQLIKEQLATLKESINYDALDANSQLSYRIFVLDAEQRIELDQYRDYQYPVNQMRGLQSYVASFLINYHRVDSKSDLEAYIARLAAIKPLFDQLTVNLKRQAQKGIIIPKFVFAHVRSDSQNILAGAPFNNADKDSTLFADFKTKMSKLSLSADEKKQLTHQASTALLNHVKPAYTTLLTYLDKLESQANTDSGAWKFPDGKNFYALKLRHTTTTDLTAEQIHQTGVDEVARIHSEMRGILKKVNFKGDLSAFFEFMRKDRQFFYANTDQGRQAYLQRAEEVIATMKNQLDDLFITKPKADLVVKAVEAFREKSAGKAFYSRPAPNGSRPGIYYANLHDMNDMPIYELEALAYHEGIPGHHMQLAISMELDDIPKFRKHSRFTAYTEGWGLYSEFVGKQMGGYQDPYSDFGRLSMELWRACRLVVDTGIHTKRWTREQAIQYLDKNTPAPHMQSVKAIERYIVMPSQATAYKIGMLKIIALRKHAQTTLGDQFDIREFHDVVLRSGPLPLNLLEEQVHNWVLSKSTQTSST